ncbi:MAG: hypothetical protein J3K34DRAFT_143627 [Monoraphidium minutum]|nr:MAG: hypothetical protein J3K34DRAFT_143627 [Monoraphidium minutum]
MQGTADLTFKMKKVDPKVLAGALVMMPEAAGAKLTKKVENDIHCDHTRETMSPLYRPVRQDLDISTAGGVADYFPNLAQVALLEPEEPLQYMHTVWRSKTVWTVVFGGVVGEANLVIKYNTTFKDAVAGATPKNGELSLRIRREAAGPTSEDQMWRALDSLADACQAFRDEGWDGKTPAWDPNPDPSPAPSPGPEPAPPPGAAARPAAGAGGAGGAAAGDYAGPAGDEGGDTYAPGDAGGDDGSGATGDAGDSSSGHSEAPGRAAAARAQ